MKNQRGVSQKWIASAVTMTLIASVGAPVASASFYDVTPDYKAAVDFVLSKGIKGVSETEFGVYTNIKRVDAAVMLVQVLGLDINSAPSSGFTDVPSRAVKYVNALKAAGITKGTSPTVFNSSSAITRGELAVWIQKGFHLKNSNAVSFVDVPNYLQEAVGALVSNKITNGISSTMFGTNMAAKRGDYAIFLKRAYDATRQSSFTVKGINGREIQITFSQPVREDTLIANNRLKPGIMKIQSQDANDYISKASLSNDQRVLTLTGNRSWGGTYAVKLIADKVQTAYGMYFSEHSAQVNIIDSTPPSVNDVRKIDNYTYDIIFSEPISGTDYWFYSYIDNEGRYMRVNGREQILSDERTLRVSLDKSTPLNKVITAGCGLISDFRGNALREVNIQLGEDKAVPIITEIRNARFDGYQSSFDIKLSEPVIDSIGSGITVNGYETKASIDRNDKTIVHVSVNVQATVDAKVVIPKGTFTDLNGNHNETTVKYYTIKDMVKRNVVTVRDVASPGMVVIEFSGPVNRADAEDVSNYRIMNSPAFKSAYLVRNAVDGARVELKLEDNIIWYSGVNQISVDSIAPMYANQLANEPTTQNAYIIESTSPKVLDRTVTSLNTSSFTTTIRFDEDGITNGPNDDFALYVNGTYTGHTMNASYTSATDRLAVSWSKPIGGVLYDLTKASSIKLVPTATMDIKDAATNLADIPQIIIK